MCEKRDFIFFYKLRIKMNLKLIPGARVLFKLRHLAKYELQKQLLNLGNCDIFMKRKISVINETKQDEILLKLKVYDHENLRGIP